MLSRKDLKSNFCPENSWIMKRLIMALYKFRFMVCCLVMLWGVPSISDTTLPDSGVDAD